ncbi:hypothetical protein [Lysobacter antibioticus]|nr:hypothetical protein [Lysobacter antibioticus]
MERSGSLIAYPARLIPSGEATALRNRSVRPRREQPQTSSLAIVHRTGPAPETLAVRVIGDEFPSHTQRSQPMNFARMHDEMNTGSCKSRSVHFVHFSL